MDIDAPLQAVRKTRGPFTSEHMEETLMGEEVMEKTRVTHGRNPVLFSGCSA